MQAAAVTKKHPLRRGHQDCPSQHPVDVAIQAATTDHVIGIGRFIFGFGSGVPAALFCEERGMTFEERHDRLNESLALIRKCWSSEEPFDWDGKYWKGKGITALPRPFRRLGNPMATATDQDEMLKLAGRAGWTILSAFLEPSDRLRLKADNYCAAAEAVGRKDPRRNISVSRLVYIADSKKQAMDDMREEITYELGFQVRRGLLNFARNVYKLR